MRILLATGIFPPDIGGPATYTEELAQGLKARGFGVGVVTYSDSKDKTQDVGYDFPVVKVSRKLLKGVRHLVYFFKLSKAAKESDVIYAQNPVSAGVVAALVAKLLKKNLVLKVVGDAAWEKAREKGLSESDVLSFQKERHKAGIGFLRKLERYTAKRATLIITPSRFLKEVVKLWGIEETKIKVVYNSTEKIEAVGISKEEAQERIGIKGDIILSIGRLSPWKGFSALCEVMQDLIKLNPNFKLLIVGDGEERETLKAKIKNLGLENSVKLKGRVPHKEIPLYFKASDIFVLNSQYEGLPHVVLEAMQSGVAVIASLEGGNPEVIENNVNGFLVRYNNKEEIKEAILKLRRDGSLRKKFIQNSKQKLQVFSFNKMMEKTINLLTSTVNSNPTTAR